MINLCGRQRMLSQRLAKLYMLRAYGADTASIRDDLDSASLPGLPAAQTLGVGRLNTAEISREALAAGRAGIATHYLGLRERYVQRHHAANQVVGCGFPASRAVLLWELARDVDYIFTNNAVRMERWRREALDCL